MRPRLTLYVRLYCHLCETMMAELADQQKRLDFAVDPIDVDTDSRLVEQFGVQVPVLMLGERHICHYHLDLEALRSALAAE